MVTAERNRQVSRGILNGSGALKLNRQCVSNFGLPCDSQEVIIPTDGFGPDENFVSAPSCSPSFEFH
jgi:hypothetical protein